MRKIISIYPIILLLCLFPSEVNGFDLEGYYAKNKGQGKENFVKTFPYYTYLQQVQFTDFKTLQQHRRFLWRTFGEGDDFLYYLGENFMKYYPPQLAHLTDTISIGEAYLAEKQEVNPATNEVYQIIGYYILGKAAQTIEEHIRKGKFDPKLSQNAQIIDRLEKNRIYVSLEEGAMQKLITNIKQGKWEYVFNRVWLKFRETEQKASTRYDALLGPDFFREFYPLPDSSLPRQPTESNLQLESFQRFYPLKGGNDYAVHIFAMQENGKTPPIGHAVWLRRPTMKSTYFAHGNVSTQYQQWASRHKKIPVLATTGGFTNIHRKPEGLTIENGQIVNAVLMPDRDGLVIVHKGGGISVVNLERTTIKLSLGTQTVLTIENPLQSLIAYSKLLHWCSDHKATLFQTQLLAYSNDLLIDVAKAKGQLRERRLLALIRDAKTSELHHVVLDIPTPHNLAIIAKDIFNLLKSREKNVEALLNLDVGSYNILQVFNEQGKVLAVPQGPVGITKATNLIVYTR